MKFTIIVGALMLAGGVLAAKGLNIAGQDASIKPIAAAEPKGVAFHCRAVTSNIWPYATEADPSLRKLSNVQGVALLNYAEAQFCACAEKELGKHKSSGSKALFGTLAGHDMALRFSKHFTKKRRDNMRKDLQKLAKRHRGIVEAKPAWLKKMNKTFAQCRKDGEINSALLSSIVRLQK